jgi:hypothetical protein
MIRRTVGRRDLSTVEGQSAAVADALPILEGLEDPVRRSEYAHLVADLAGVAEPSVVIALERRLEGRPAEVAKTMKRVTAQERIEREMLKLLVRDADTYRELVGKLEGDHFRNASHRRAFSALRDADGDVSALVAGADEKLAATISALAVEPLEGEPDDRYADRVWGRLQEFLLKGRSEALRARLQKMNPTTEPGYDELFSELVATDGELRRLRSGEPSVL